MSSESCLSMSGAGLKTSVPTESVNRLPSSIVSSQEDPSIHDCEHRWMPLAGHFVCALCERTAPNA